MYLSDSDADDPNLRRFRIPDGTTTGPVDTPSSYLVFYENVDFGNPANPNANQPFALSENRDAVYLTHAVDGVLTILAEEEFGAAEPNVAFGRHIKSAIDGGVNFVAMNSNTPGADNDCPKVGPIVINEIAYNPYSDDDAEFVELLNVSGSSVTLFDSAENEPWRLVDDPENPGLELKFPRAPSAITLADDEYLLLVKDKAAFETVFLGANDIGTLGVQWLEWGTPNGSLSNGGEKLELQMPGDLDGAERMYIRIDRVSYSDGSHPVGEDPWPTGPDDSDVYTLGRKAAAAYGNDVINWQAVSPTPGAVNPSP
jgi:hypothetical protein